MSEISGGITNLLWKLTPSLKSGLGPVVVRVFGEQTDLLIDRERERGDLLQLNEAGFGAPVKHPSLVLQRHFPCEQGITFEHRNYELRASRLQILISRLFHRF